MWVVWDSVSQATITDMNHQIVSTLCVCLLFQNVINLTENKNHSYAMTHESFAVYIFL